MLDLVLELLLEIMFATLEAGVDLLSDSTLEPHSRSPDRYSAGQP
jgi:hypothetical protein